MRRSVSTTLTPLLFALCAGILGGCASSQSAQEKATARAAVIGTWEYNVEGTAPLDQGIFRITTKDGQLQGIIRDRRLGRLRARVDANDSRLELAVDDLRISGYIEDDEFRGSLRRRQWNVSTRRRYRRRSRFRSASVFARRVQSGTAADTPSVLECRSILREANGCK
ncbi:MAG: hypothetical protein BRD28_06125 [Bacteroidetes bacterium QH_10_64_37]|jgi:hypothetical protein|nr:MAG: hypothetical protein BRD28_06125 [Bacteroidetes bacterium QH_10_64_37]